MRERPDPLENTGPSENQQGVGKIRWRQCKIMIAVPCKGICLWILETILLL
jgi:hypothetical protein